MRTPNLLPEAANAAPSDLDLAQVTAGPHPPDEVLGGYVVRFGAFKVSKVGPQCMALVGGSFPKPPSFDHVTMDYQGTYTDGPTGTHGAMYLVTFKNGSAKYFLFGDRDVGTDPDGPTLRHLIVYKKVGNSGVMLLDTLALYARE